MTIIAFLLGALCGAVTLATIASLYVGKDSDEMQRAYDWEAGLR